MKHKDDKKILGDSCLFLNPPGLRVGRVPKDMDLSLGFLSLYITPPPRLKTMADIEKEVGMINEDLVKLDNVYLLESGSELDYILGLEDGNTAVALSMQGLPEDVDVKRLKDLGIRIAPLMYGSGSGSTDLEKFIKDCAENGIKVDLSHSDHKTARDAIHFAKKFGLRNTVIASHTGCYGVYENPRNLPDDVLWDIADMGGIVGISTITFHLDEKNNSINPLLWHIKEAISLCGEKNVCIGSDRPYVKMGEGWWKKRVEWMREKLDPENKSGIRFPDQAFILNTPRKMSVIHEVLLTTDWCNEALADKLAGGNLYTFMKEYM